MSSDLARYVVNPGPKAAVTGPKAAVTTDSSIVTETMVNVLEFHNALRENGVTSVLVTYPQEGHGIRTFSAKIDHAARIVDWFERCLRNNHDSL